MPNVLVTGASGLLGGAVSRLFTSAGWNVAGTSQTRQHVPQLVRMELESLASIKRVVEVMDPQVIVHCAATRGADTIERDAELARDSVDVSAARFLASEAAKNNIFFIYISCADVFSGSEGEAPYATTALPEPHNLLGQIKHLAEKAVLEELDSARGIEQPAGVILRVPMLYGHCPLGDHNQSAVHRLDKRCREARHVNAGSGKIEVDHFFRRCPTSIEDVARVIHDIVILYTCRARPALPRILHFSGPVAGTDFSICEMIGGELYGYNVAQGMLAYNPICNGFVEPSNPHAQRPPHNTQLDTSVLQELGINTATQHFHAWW